MFALADLLEKGEMGVMSLVRSFGFGEFFFEFGEVF